MPRSCPTQVRYGSGTINPTKNGRFDCFLLIGGKRHRSRQPNMGMARAWIDMVEDSERHNTRPLTNLQMADAQRAIGHLPPGTSLTDAAKLAADSHKGSVVPQIGLSDALDRFSREKAISIAPITLKSYTLLIDNLVELLGDVSLQSVTQEHVEMLLQNVAPVTRNSKIRTLAVFFNWCKARGFLDEAPTARVARARETEPPKAVFTVEEARNLMKQAEIDNKVMIPYLALGLFAGIRPTELLRMAPDKIKKKFIMLDGSVTKTADARTIHVRPNLRAWLDKYPPKGKHVHPDIPRRQLYQMTADLAKSVGITWPKDGMRHSFATYAYELTKDAAMVASEMGHHGTDIFFRHYRALANPGDGKRFFAIRPAK